MRALFRCGVVGGLVFVCLLVLAGPVFARTVHPPVGSVGGFKEPLGVAVDDVSHDVYVVDSGDNRVEKFNSTLATLLCEIKNGVPNPEAPVEEPLLEPTEIAVDNAAGSPSHGDVYVIESGRGVVEKYDSTCNHVDTLTGSDTLGERFQSGQALARSLTGVAVDTKGMLWVGLEKGPIVGFDSSVANKYTEEVETDFGGESSGLGIDGKGSFYINKGLQQYAKVDGRGKTEVNPFGGDREAQRVAVDPVHEEVYLDNSVSIDAFRTDGTPEESCVEPTKLDNCFGAGLLSSSFSIAVDSSDGEVYATDFLTGKVLAFEAVTLPEVEILPVSERHTRSLTLNGDVNPEGKPVTECFFEYDTKPYLEEGEAAHGTSVPCSPTSVGSGSASVRVSAHLTGLMAQTLYYYRLAAESSLGKSVTSNQEVFTGPLVKGLWTVDVTSGSATVRAAIDPNGDDAHYYIEYGPTTDYGSFAPLSAPGVDLGSRVEQQTVSAHIQDLDPAMTYDYRVVVVQDGELFGCDKGSETAGECDSTFTTFARPVSNSLFDGREWELVSPPNKNGALISVTGQVQAAVGGSGIAYVSQGPNVGDEPVGHATISQALSRRAGAGWQSQDLTLPGRLPGEGESAVHIAGYQPEYRLFSTGLEQAVVEPQVLGTPLLSPEASERTVYLRDDRTGGFTPLASPADVPAGAVIEPKGPAREQEHSEWQTRFLAATPDLRHVLFKTPAALTPEAIEEEYPTVSCEQKAEPHCYVPKFVQWNIYEWSEGELRLVNILPGNAGVAHGRYAASPPVRLAGMVNVNGAGHGGAQRSMSDDGRFVAWTLGEPYAPEERVHYRGLYLRDMVEEKTVRVGGEGAVYQTMNEDGSKVFYLENGELYVYDREGAKTTSLTAGHGVSEPNGEVQETVSDVSKDGSYVYFVAKGVLAAGGGKGGNNLYLAHDTPSGWVTTWIAALSSNDKPSWFTQQDFGVPFLADVSSRVSPDGRFLAFMSERSLTGYDNVDAVSGRRDVEVFLYDAQEGTLVCASCDPSGARPTGVFDSQQAELVVDREGVWVASGSNPTDPRSDHWLAGSIPGWDDVGSSTTYQPRYLSDSGRLFFDSPDGLVPQATNGLENVYEYEPGGVGACRPGSGVFSTRSHGCVSVMSSGTSSSESTFYDASETGNDVFFATASKLTPRDYDNGYDVYDAHVCTAAVPCVAASEPQLPCVSGDACKAAPSPQPEIFDAPPSATFDGMGNVAASPSSPKPRALTMAQRLARALRACRKEKGRRGTSCRRAAHRRFGANSSRQHGAGRSSFSKGGSR